MTMAFKLDTELFIKEKDLSFSRLLVRHRVTQTCHVLLFSRTRRGERERAIRLIDLFEVYTICGVFIICTDRSLLYNDI